jgi:hypothetical protein
MKPLAITLKPPITTKGSPTALASATTPSRSGPEGSGWDMAAADSGGKKLHGLLREPLSLGDTFGGSESTSLLLTVVALLAVELSPLGVVTGLEERLSRWGAHVLDFTLVGQR